MNATPAPAPATPGLVATFPDWAALLTAATPAPIPAARRLCAPCQARWLAWLDYRLPPAPVRLVAIGGRPERDVADARDHRFQEWRDTITQQQALIRDACLNGSHAPA